MMLPRCGVLCTGNCFLLTWNAQPVSPRWLCLTLRQARAYSRWTTVGHENVSSTEWAGLGRARARVCVMLSSQFQSCGDFVRALTCRWHSHVALQRSNGLYGAFIILAKPSVNEAKLLGYSAELEPLLLNDW